MALTATIDANGRQRLGKFIMVTGTLGFDASYPTNGEPITAVQLGFPHVIQALVFLGGDAPTKRLSWDKTNSKVLVYLETGGTFAEQGNTTDPGISAARFMALGW